MSNYQQQPPNWGQQPTQPGYGYPPPPGYPQPQPPKKPSAGKIIGLGCLGVVGLFIIIGIVGAIAAGGSGDTSDTSSKDKAVTATDKATTASKPKEKPAAPKPVEQKTQAEQFQACVAKSGTATEKQAVTHVTKVTGADKSNDILDSAEVFTDYTGGLIGPHASDGKLIASAFASCYESKNGLVTVYDEKGEMLSNGNY